MMYPHANNLPSPIEFLLGVLILVDTTAAVCTNWTHRPNRRGHWSVRVYGYDDRTVDTLVCPADAGNDCDFSQRAYDFNITVKPGIYTRNSEDGFSRLEPLVLPDEEADAIFEMAEDGFNREESRRDRRHLDFATIEGPLPTPPRKCLKVRAGYTARLHFTPVLVLSRGTLGGCSNETLNNLTVTAATSEFLYGGWDRPIVIAGAWGAVPTWTPHAGHEGDEDDGVDGPGSGDGESGVDDGQGSTGGDGPDPGGDEGDNGGDTVGDVPPQPCLLNHIIDAIRAMLVLGGFVDL